MATITTPNTFISQCRVNYVTGVPFTVQYYIPNGGATAVLTYNLQYFYWK